MFRDYDFPNFTWISFGYLDEWRQTASWNLFPSLLNVLIILALSNFSPVILQKRKKKALKEEKNKTMWFTWIPKNELLWQLSLNTPFIAGLRNARTPEDKLWDDSFPCPSTKCSFQVFSNPIQILASKNRFLWKRPSANIFTTSFCLWKNKVNFYNYKNNSYSLRKIIKCEENVIGM